MNACILNVTAEEYDPEAEPVIKAEVRDASAEADAAVAPEEPKA